MSVSRQMEMLESKHSCGSKRAFVSTCKTEMYALYPLTINSILHTNNQDHEN